MEKVDQKRFSDCLECLEKSGHIVENKRVTDIYYETKKGEKKPVASIFPDDRYIQFHDEFTQIGIDIPAFKEMMQSWHNNHT